MGNYRFKLSELIPNAWFHKLKDMSTSKKHHKQPASPSLNKKHHAVSTSTTTTARSPRPSTLSSHNTSWPPITPRKPARNRLHHRVTVDSKSSTTSGDSAATGTGSFSPDFRSDQLLLPDEVFTASSCHNSPCVSNLSKSTTFTPPPELDLRPIITKPATTSRKTAVSSRAGVRVRLRSPRISTRKSVSGGERRSGSTSRRSRAVMKASVDPRRDFKESMEEMIAENNIRESKDLEELLACYLCLNSEEYHTIIINVFKQIWLDLNLPLPHSK